MAKTLHVIYVPGLGDTNVNMQRRASNWWRFWGVTPELVQMKWADDEKWEQKLGRLLARIDELVADGHQVALVGASAGAAAVVCAFVLRKDAIVGCVLVSGKVNRPQTIGDPFRRRSPRLVEAVEQSVAMLESLDISYKQKILSLYALADETVYKPDSHIEGARNKIVLSIGHLTTIAIQMTLGAPSFLGFLKRLAKV